MRSRARHTLWVGVLASAGTGCVDARVGGAPDAQRPDYPDFYVAKPLQADPPHGYCALEGDSLRVMVGNLGNAAEPTVVSVVYSHDLSREPVRSAVDPIAPGAAVEVALPVVPAPGPDQSFGFTIFVDPWDDVVELTEANNRVAGWCER